MTTYFISDLHLGHQKTIDTFKRADGSPLRDFKSTDDMDEKIIENWNSIVKEDDIVKLLGDVVMNMKHAHKIKRLNGIIEVYLGNHDNFTPAELAHYFDKVRGVYSYRSSVLSHVPLEIGSVEQRYTLNIHGHLHDNVVNNPKYLNVSVEQTNYMPITYDECLRRHDENVKSFINTGEVINWADTYKS